MCVCVTVFHLIKSPCWHIGQIDQLGCQLSWQISPSVSLFLEPTTPLPPLPFSPPLPRSHFHFDSDTLAIKRQEGGGKKGCLLMRGVIFLVSTPPLLDAFQGVFFCPHQPLADGCQPVLTDVTFSWHWLLSGLRTTAPTIEDDGRHAQPSSFCYQGSPYCLDTPAPPPSLETHLQNAHPR